VKGGAEVDGKKSALNRGEKKKQSREEKGVKKGKRSPKKKENGYPEKRRGSCSYLVRGVSLGRAEGGAFLFYSSAKGRGIGPLFTTAKVGKKRKTTIFF